MLPRHLIRIIKLAHANYVLYQRTLFPFSDRAINSYAKHGQKPVEAAHFRENVARYEKKGLNRYWFWGVLLLDNRMLLHTKDSTHN